MLSVDGSAPLLVLLGLSGGHGKDSQEGSAGAMGPTPTLKGSSAQQPGSCCTGGWARWGSVPVTAIGPCLRGQ